ncbi:response regulator transcription factor [Desulfosporosinus fructosivorans]|uniref:Stage 0 sporulation protein A homolog n=1 Tax=Desulfosporosinus fructosivorans TaxID=2018669 RepID=A0A4Z0R1V3_9FIRM|nr:response regulator transcription factor [Desulfosporosinus fructosivorans]TGE35596.1 response regulator transcription factor [Desulfosporosinus fructosivorans]
MSKILIVEDDNEIAMLEKDYLEISGYETELIQDGCKVVDAVLAGEYDLILLDLMLPGSSGYDICREIRDKIDVPILMVTAKAESIDKIRGLGLGADDYIAKPFDPAELVARVKSHLSRYERLAGGGLKKKPVLDTLAQQGTIQIGNLKIMTLSYKAYRGEQEIKFPNREFELLRFLAMNPDIVFSKEQLFVKIWGYDYVSDSATVMVHINRIREKIEEDPGNPKIIETVWGAGYRLNA